MISARHENTVWIGELQLHQSVEHLHPKQSAVGVVTEKNHIEVFRDDPVTIQILLFVQPFNCRNERLDIPVKIPMEENLAAFRHAQLLRERPEFRAGRSPLKISAGSVEKLLIRR